MSRRQSCWGLAGPTVIHGMKGTGAGVITIDLVPIWPTMVLYSGGLLIISLHYSCILLLILGVIEKTMVIFIRILELLRLLIMYCLFNSVEYIYVDIVPCHNA